MTGEAAAKICAAMAQEVRAVRASGAATSSLLGEMMEHLSNAPATTIVDALALAAVSRRILSASVGEFHNSDVQLMDQTRFQAALALTFLHRAVETLEVKTGLSAEGFTGEADALN